MSIAVVLLALFFVSTPATAPSRARQSARSPFNGVYRIDIPASDKLYSVVAGASSKIPYREQQRFFIDLAVRFTPPDLLAIEQRGNQITVGSSRSPRMTFIADGVMHHSRSSDGRAIRSRLSMDNDRLVFASEGTGEDNFTVTFESRDGGRLLYVVRRLTAEGLNQPLVIRSVYNRVSTEPRWELYGESDRTAAAAATMTPVPAPAADESPAVNLRESLREWISATNKRDIDKQMAYYASRLRAYYLARNVSQDFVRDEKGRVFKTATLIDIQADQPEIIFLNGGNVAVMRYRKRYRIENGRRSRRGEVIQELRWQRTGEGWRIFSERDIKVL